MERFMFYTIINILIVLLACVGGYFIFKDHSTYPEEGMASGWMAILALGSAAGLVAIELIVWGISKIVGLF